MNLNAPAHQRPADKTTAPLAPPPAPPQKWRLIHAAPRDLMAPPAELSKSATHGVLSLEASYKRRAEPILQSLQAKWQALDQGFTEKLGWDELERLHLELRDLEKKLRSLQAHAGRHLMEVLKN